MGKQVTLAKQQETLDRFFRLVKQHHPDAKRVAFETSDQSGGYGFVAMHYYSDDGDEPHLFASEIEHEIFLDIDWNGIMKEDDQGYATLDIPFEPKYHAVKMFETTNMPSEVAKTLHEGDHLEPDGICGYVVGSVGACCRDDDDIDAEKRWAVVDQWFIANGAAHKEHVLVHHGEFDPNLYEVLVSDG